MKRREDGAAVVVAIGLMAFLILVALIGGGVVAMVAAHRQVQSAADLAVLAGASAALDGADPCVAVAQVASRNGGKVASCEIDGAVVTAVVERNLTGVLSDKTVRATARAGPG